MTTNHLDTVVAAERTIAVCAVVMLFVLVDSSISFCRPGVVTDVAFISEVILVPHVLDASPPAPKPSRASVAFEIGRLMASCATVVFPSSPAGGEDLTAGAAFIVIVLPRHGNFLQ